VPALIALTRPVSDTIGACQLAHLARQPIDLPLARAQHRDYERALTECGCRIVRLPAESGMPDAVFVEDVALVFDELAVVTRPGAESRRPERQTVAEALATYRPTCAIERPGTLDGGDVLTSGRRVFIGRSARTNSRGIEQLVRILEPCGYAVEAVPVSGCLHLKSAVTAIGDQTLLINSRWVPRAAFRRYDLLDVDPEEPFAANALLVGKRLVYPASFPRTLARLEAAGLHVRRVDISELAKAEGAVTCCSVVFADD
jgi:dimethylargininase